jgi:hypothetical protein
MLLKCRYLAQFSVAELKKNPSQFAKAAQQCPFMRHAQRTLSTATPTMSSNTQVGDTDGTEMAREMSFTEMNNKEKRSWFSLYIIKLIFNLNFINILFKKKVEAEIIQKINNNNS